MPANADFLALEAELLGQPDGLGAARPKQLGSVHAMRPN
jgi:hypothetical protein